MMRLRGFGDCFGLRMDLKLLVNVTHVGLYGVDADFEFRCRRCVVMSFDQQFQNRSS